MKKIELYKFKQKKIRKEDNYFTKSTINKFSILIVKEDKMKKRGRFYKKIISEIIYKIILNIIKTFIK